MNAKKLFSLLLILFGETLIIFCFLHFYKNVQPEILTLNVVVSSIIYCLLFANIIFPCFNLKDKSHKQIGSIGLRWFFTFLYSLLAIGVIIFFNTVKPILFTNQFIIHGILFFLLLLGFFMSFSSSDKVRDVYFDEKQNREGIDEMRKVTKELQIKLDAMNDIPIDIINRINELQENLRYLSASNNSEALGLEIKYVEEVRQLINCFSNDPLNLEIVIRYVNNCEWIYKERKQVFSN